VVEIEKVLVMFSLDGTDFPVSQEKKPLLEVRMVSAVPSFPLEMQTRAVSGLRMLLKSSL